MEHTHSGFFESAHDQPPSWPTAQHAMRCKKLSPTDAVGPPHKSDNAGCDQPSSWPTDHHANM
eukprot:6236735-Karenia_brevis.AAC.1